MKNISEWRKMLWIILPVYLISNAYLIYLTEVNLVILLFANALYLALIAWLTSRVTDPLTAEETDSPENKSRIWLQISLLIVVILLTGFSRGYIPFWSGMVDWFHSIGESFLPVEWFGGPGNAVANPVQYFLIPLILLITLGAKPAELGFGKGNKVWKACLVWLALPVVIWIGLLVTGFIPLQTLIRRIIANTFQNGFFEEFLFRGALQTRLRRVMSSSFALTLQAFIFGLWHLRGNTQSMDGNILAGLALCVVSQTVSGFVYGYVFQRTRNLTASSVAHVAMNVLGQSLG